jgi:DNA excision repair protein ERCC-6
VTRDCPIRDISHCIRFVLQELHSLLKFCAPDDIGEWPRFRDQYEKPIEASFKPDASEYEIKRGDKLIHELQDNINPFILQRYKRDHLKGVVPPNHEFDVWTRLSATQRQLYSEAIKNVEQLLKNCNSKDTFGCVLPAITRLRNLCQHPLIFSVADEPGKYSQAAFQLTLQSIGRDEVVARSPKLVVLLELLHMWCDQGCKTLVFCHSIVMLDIIQFALDHTEGLKACRIDGKTSQVMRARLVTEINRVGSTFNIMLLSINAGGEGLSLTGANKSVVYDPAWNLAKTDQAVARTSRPGQTRECECIHLLTAGTVEEKVRPFCMPNLAN